MKLRIAAVALVALALAVLVIPNEQIFLRAIRALDQALVVRLIFRLSESF
jgi:hypothetical protein